MAEENVRVVYGRTVQKQQEGQPEAIVLFDNIVEAIGINEKAEIFEVTLKSLGEYAGKFEVVKVEKRSQKKRAKKTEAAETKSKRKYTKRSKYWK